MVKEYRLYDSINISKSPGKFIYALFRSQDGGWSVNGRKDHLAFSGAGHISFPFLICMLIKYDQLMKTEQQHKYVI